MPEILRDKPVLLVLSSTYPRWHDDHEPGFVHELCRRLTKWFQVIALVPDAPDADPGGIMDGVEIVRYRYAPRAWQTLINNGGIATNLKRSPWKWLLVPGFLLAQYMSARRLICSRRVDFVHAHWLIPQGLVAWMLARGKHSLPYAVTSHGGDLYGLQGGLVSAIKRRVATSASAMTVVSAAMAEKVRQLGVEKPKPQVLPMGVDFQAQFIPDPSEERSSGEILFVGRLVPKKGLSKLLEAFPAIAEACPDASITIAGFGPELEKLKQQALHLKIDDKINFAGATPQHKLPALYRRAAVFVAPFVRDDTGNQEGLPVVLMEAIGCGCPAVVGAVDGIDDLLGPFYEEMAVTLGDISMLAQAVIRVLKAPEEARRRAHVIRNHVAERCDWQIVSAGYGKLLNGCIGTTAGRD